MLPGSAKSGTGNAHANAIKGSVGDDTLDGGAGNDTLTGGNGNDTYIVEDLRRGAARATQQEVHANAEAARATEQAARATRNFAIAKGTVDRIVFDIAQACER